MNRLMLVAILLAVLAVPVVSLAFGNGGELPQQRAQPLPQRSASPWPQNAASSQPSPAAAGLGAGVGGGATVAMKRSGVSVVGPGVAVRTGVATPRSPTPTAATQPASTAPGAGRAVDTNPSAQPAEPLAAWGRPPAPSVDPRRFTEAHWQGLEVVPNTPALAKMLNIPPDLRGVIVDDVTLPADLQGFRAGDVVMQVGSTPTGDLLGFIDATEGLRAQQSTNLTIWRDGVAQKMSLVALRRRLGTANGETPSMIPPNARMPHPYRGPCTNCHRIGRTGTLAADQGDPMPTTVPDIRVGARRPHEDRGACNVCHRILP